MAREWAAVMTYSCQLWIEARRSGREIDEEALNAYRSRPEFDKMFEDVAPEDVAWQRVQDIRSLAEKFAAFHTKNRAKVWKAADAEALQA
eukprot:1760028-Amphidinium_carterae.1